MHEADQLRQCEIHHRRPVPSAAIGDNLVLGPYSAGSKQRSKLGRLLDAPQPSPRTDNLFAAAITKKSFAPAATLRHTVTMLSRCNQKLLTTHSRAQPVRVRRYIAGLMALVVFVASFALAAREPGLAMSANGRAVAEMTTSGKYLPKPCQKIVLPGTVNTCPLSSFSFNFIPSVGANAAGPTLVAAVQWQMSNSSLAAQCCGFSPYRPPCSEA